MTVSPDVQKFSAMDIFIAFLRTMNMWLTLIVILGYGNKLLNFPHKAINYMNEAAFPIYIIHQSILVVVGYYIVKLNVGIYPKFFMIMFLTLAASFLLYEFVIKRLAVTRMLFGIKVRKKDKIQSPGLNINHK